MSHFCAVVGGVHAWSFREVPQGGPEIQQAAAEAAGALVAHPGALLKQVHQAVVNVEQFGLMPGDGAALSLMFAVGGEDLPSGLFELTAESRDPPATLDQRLWRRKDSAGFRPGGSS